MKERYLSLDFLRGLSIFGMVFSAIVPSAILPAWMYHIQNPPPLHELNTTVLGIGWVDLVFPVFIFCMGVAIPLSGRAKLNKNISTAGYIKECVTRFIMLWFFSYAYVLLNYSNIEGFWAQFFTLLGFCALFPLYLVIKPAVSFTSTEAVKKNKNKVRYIRIAGLLSILALIAVGHFFFGEVISVQRRGIIIFLLAFLYLFGSLVWYFTRDKKGGRILVFSVVFLFTNITKGLDWPAITYADPNIRWWFNIEYIYFLLLLIPSTVVGDVLYKRLKEGNIYAKLNTPFIHVVFPVILLWVIWLCYAFYMDLLWINIVVSTVMSGLLLYAICKKMPQYRDTFIIAVILLLWGMIMIPIDNGITKVPCSISYCFVTCAISILLLMISDYICKYIPRSLLVSVFTGAGKNPLMSYIAFDSLVVPLMKITGFIALYRAAYPPDYPLLGVLRAALAVFFTMWIVSLFSRKDVFWKA